MICIIDDDDAARDSLQLLLEFAGIESLGFASCEDFAATAQPNLADCLILDIHMHGMDGLALLEELRRRGEKTPAIVVTGAPSAANTRRAHAAGAIAVLEKPFKAAEILALVRSAATDGQDT